MQAPADNTWQTNKEHTWKINGVSKRFWKRQRYMANRASGMPWMQVGEDWERGGRCVHCDSTKSC